MTYYITRMWLDQESEIYIEDERRWVRVEDMSEMEFRKFLLWRLGLALPPKSVKRIREMVAESRPSRRRR